MGEVEPQLLFLARSLAPLSSTAISSTEPSSLSAQPNEQAALTSQGERLTGSLSAIKARAPVLGGNFGIWGGLFSSFDCAVKGYRQKEDPWNAIISGFLVGGTLAFRCE